MKWVFNCQVLNMSFGDWELFRMLAVALRERELTSFNQVDETNANKNVRFTVPSIQATGPPQDRERERRRKFDKIFRNHFESLFVSFTLYYYQPSCIMLFSLL